MVSRIMSADSHVLEPPDLWTKRMSPKFRDTAPHVIHESKGQTGDFFYAAPLPPFNVTTLGCGGLPPVDDMGGYKACRVVGIPLNGSWIWTLTA